MKYQRAAGAGHDRLAASGVITAELVRAPKPMPVEKKAEEKPKPVEKPKLEPAPNPKAEIKLKPKKAKPIEKKEQPAEEKPAEPAPPAQQLTLEEELAGVGKGVQGGKGQGDGGNAPETILNHKGTLMLGGEMTSRLSGKTFHLEMGRVDLQGGNRLINTVITLHPDGTSDVTLTHYYFQTYHEQYSSTRDESGTGHWWIEGNRWCHQSPIINYNTKDCYDLASEGPEVRLYYAPCGADASQLCKTGRLAGVGEVK
ncbi:MAG TPA: hypothetical protein VF449_07820 [Parvibaculum sp.]